MSKYPGFAVAELWEVGVAMRRERLRESNPSATDAELDQLILGWLTDRPGDADGIQVSWPRLR